MEGVPASSNHCEAFAPLGPDSSGCTNPSSVASDHLPQESWLPAPGSGNSHREAMAFFWARPRA